MQRSEVDFKRNLLFDTRIREHVHREKHTPRDPSKRIESQNTENRITIGPRNTIYGLT